MANFSRNNGNIVGNKTVISAYLENAGQGHHLQKSLHLSYYTTDFNQNFTEMMKLGLAKAPQQLTLEI